MGVQQYVLKQKHEGGQEHVNNEIHKERKLVRSKSGALLSVLL